MATAPGFDETAVPGTSVDAAGTSERTTLRKTQNKPAALIVCERWECALQGGVAGAVSILTQLFQAIGMVVHCTLLKTNPTVNKEAKDRGIKLCLPCEVVGLQLDALEPKSDWLMEHDNFFPDMRAIENVEAEWALHICSLLDKHDADSLNKHIYLANVMKEVTESFVKMFTKPPKWKILGVPPGKESEIRKRLQTHTKLEVTCFSTTSLKEFECELQTSHLVLIPPKSVNVLDLALTSMAIGVPVLAPKDSICHSFVEEFMEEFETDLLVNMNGNTAVLAEKIIYTIKKHSAVLKKMKLIKRKIKKEVIPKIKEINDVFAKFMKTKLQMAEVDIETDHQTTGGVSHDKESIPADRADSQTVEGDGEQMEIQPDESSRYQSAETSDVGNPSGDEAESAAQCSAEKFSESKEDEKGNTSERRPSERAVTQGQTLKRKRHSGESEKDDTDSDNSDTTSTSSALSSEQGRNNCEVKVKLGIEGVVLVKGKSVEDVERALFPPRRRRSAMALKRKIRKLEEKAAKFRDVEVEMAKERAKIQAKLNKLHKELEVVDTETGSISFIMKCKSLQALECLMSEYSSGRLLKMMEDILVTPKVMKKLGVMYLSMQVIINMEEYQLCKKELLALQDSKRMKSRRNSVSSVYEIKSRKPTMSDLSPVSPHLHLIISSQEHGRPTVHSLLGSSAVASEQGVTALLQRTGVCVFSRRHQQLKEDKFRSVGKVITLQGMETDKLNTLRSHKLWQGQEKTQSDNQEHSLLMEKIQLKRGKESTAERGYETAKKKNKLSEEITELDHQKAKLSEQIKDKDKELASLQLQLGQVEKGKIL
ncbi:caldesmon-like [Ptychodera flava]|uniref:caldesmon-like n=1 Tax=Ptychodera flava TaxID=63121 RepID=UPI00396A9DB7